MKRIEENTAVIYSSRNMVPPTPVTQAGDGDSLTKTLTTTTGQKVEITYSERDKRAAAYVLDINNERVAVKPENMPSNLREIHDPIIFNAFLRDAWAKTSYLSNGDLRLDVNPCMRGGMMSDPADKSDKPLPTLVSELKAFNTSNPAFVPIIDRLAHQVTVINDLHAQPSRLASNPALNGKPIKNWAAPDIQGWASEIRTRRVNIDESSLPEVLAVIKQAVSRSEGFLPRDVQMFSVLSLLSKNAGSGRLAQIYTGEGKSTTISMLAVVQVLKGHKVDIVTSSEVLAARDAEEKSKFYSLFGMTVSDNCDNSRSWAKDCYEKDVVYGDTLNFEADILCDEYKRYGTRCSRPFNTVIVDEVDNMLIDEKLRMTLLSTPTPGMSALTPILEAIWHVVRFTLAAAASYASKKSLNIDPKAVVQLHLKDDMEKIKEFALSTAPQYLKDYAASQITNWCYNAVHALFSHRENEHYVVQDGDIVPVDYLRTGVLQKNMHWGEGLHQFLQMKHDLNVTQINLTTNFLSNVSYFRRYGENIFGLSGTLGSENEQGLLARLYKVDTVHIPSFKTRKLREIPGMLCNSNREWLAAVKDSILEKTAQGRAVLVICETIAKAKMIQRTLQESQYAQEHIRLYVEGSAEEQEITKQKLLPRQVILATNIAGRGTDLKITDIVEQNGGLHVCVSFLPENLRVEEQAFGRAGRQGNLGTAQLVIDATDESLSKTYARCVTIDDMKQVRDTKERRSLEIAMRETTKVINKDALFVEFCELNKQIARDTGSDSNILAALEERWALWLVTLTDKQILEQDPKRLFSAFRAEILKDHAKKEIIQNPKYYLRQGNRLLRNERYQEALGAYEIAARMNPSDWVPQYYRAITNIKLQESSKTTPERRRLLEESIGQLKDAGKLCADSTAFYQSTVARHQLQRSIVVEDEDEAQVASPLPFGSGVKPFTGLAHSKSVDRYNDLIRINRNFLDNLSTVIAAAQSSHDKSLKFSIEVKPVSEIYNATNDTKAVEALHVDGFTQVASVAKERPWIAIGITGALGAVELIIGAVLCATGVGAIWGYGLIIEGVSDIITAGVAYGTKDFNWGVYIGAKSVSIALTTAGCGFLSLGPRLGVDALKVGVVAASRALATQKLNEAEAQQQAKQELEQIMSDPLLQDKLKNIKELTDQFNSSACEKEFGQFEVKCTVKLKQEITAQLHSTLDSLVCVPSFGQKVLMVYKELSYGKKVDGKLVGGILESIAAQSLESPIADTKMLGSGDRAYTLLEQQKLVEILIATLKDKLSQQFEVSEINVVSEVASALLEQNRVSLQDAVIQQVGKDVGALTKKREELQAHKVELMHQKSQEQNTSKVKDLKVQLSDIQEEIDKVDELNNALIAFNAIRDKLQSLDKATISQMVTFLKGKVFKETQAFDIQNTNADDASSIIQQIPMADSELKQLFIQAFTHIYQTLQTKDQDIAGCVDDIVSESKLGTGSLMQMFFGRYVDKIAAANGLAVKRIVELQRVETAAAISKKRAEAVSSIGTKVPIPGDGNCFFGSVATTLGIDRTAYHMRLREMAVSYISSHRAEYEPLITDSDFSGYLALYRQDRMWNATQDGNDIMIDALAKTLGVHMVIIDESHDGISQSVNPVPNLPVIHLCYTGDHYSAMVARDLAFLRAVRDSIVGIPNAV